MIHIYAKVCFHFRSQPLFLGGGYEDETGGGGLGRLDKSCCGVTVTQVVILEYF